MNVKLQSMDLMHGQKDGALLTKVSHIDSEGSKEAGVIFWAGIVGDSLIGPFKAPEGVKMNSDNYQEFLTTNFLPWYKSQGCTFTSKCLLMHDNAPAHTSLQKAIFGVKKQW